MTHLVHCISFSGVRMTRSFFVVLMFVVGLTACGSHEVMAPVPSYNTITLKQIGQEKMSIRVGERSQNLITVCVPRGVFVNASVTQSSSSIMLGGGGYFQQGVCDDGRDLFVISVDFWGAAVGKSTVTFTLVFSRGDPMNKSFEVTVEPPLVTKGS